MIKVRYTFLALLITSEAWAQSSARALGNNLGKFIAGFLIVFLLYRFVIRPMWNKKK